MNSSMQSFNCNLIDFINQSLTPYHATLQAKQILLKNGFSELKENESWNITKGKYFVTRSDSSLIAINISKEISKGMVMAGAHTDSPTLKIRSNPEKKNPHYFQLGVEIYGGPILHTWLDRELSLAGAVLVEMSDGTLKKILIDFKRPLGIISSLAIHLDREVNDKKSIQKHKELFPILGLLNGKNISLNELLMIQIKQEHPSLSFNKILDFDLSLYDTAKCQLIGFEDEMIVGARLDNLLSCYLNLMAIISSKSNALMVLNDHEECGSTSTVGADGSFLKDFLLRITKNQEEYQKMIASSILISCDNAHAIHPNFPEKMDDAHAPIMNNGPAIKINSNQRYATNFETAGIFINHANKVEIPFQKFSARNDMPCGSTIGPITSSLLGVKTIDVGVPTFAMHSIRETAGAKDSFYLYRIISEMMNSY